MADIRLLYVFIPLFFVPFLVVIGESIFGIDVIKLGLGMTEMMWAVAGSAVIAIAVVYFLQRYGMKDINASLEFLKSIQ